MDGRAWWVMPIGLQRATHDGATSLLKYQLFSKAYKRITAPSLKCRLQSGRQYFLIKPHSLKIQTHIFGSAAGGSPKRWASSDAVCDPLSRAASRQDDPSPPPRFTRHSRVAAGRSWPCTSEIHIHFNTVPVLRKSPPSSKC